ncbi:biotin--[acetyl-CoA-carboxylase] ligase [Thermosulfuriphilus sp.]
MPRLREISLVGKLRTKWLGKRILFFKELPTTQDVGQRLLKYGELSGTVIWADRQTSGRGRLGRHWFSPSNRGLYISLILRDVGQEKLPRYALATALGVARAIEALVGLPVHLKWPNDILLNGRKLVGILVEAGEGGAVVGIGVNVSQRRQELPEEIRDRATSILEATGLKLSRARLLRQILEALEPLYEGLSGGCWPEILAEWRQRDITYGARVILISGGRPHKGIALGPDDEGFLIFRESPDRLRRLHSGEIVLWEAYARR